jgi:16S rRNA (adenine1518-N6/adenine1519-N6)-dimethyltransferase
VLEIGPGLGSLTLGLLEATRHVTRRRDRGAWLARLPRTVAERLPAAPTGSRSSRRMRWRWTPCPDPQPTAVVANLPYNVSVPVLLHVLARYDTLRMGW